MLRSSEVDGIVMEPVRKSKKRNVVSQVQPVALKTYDLKDPTLYLNRELTYLSFTRRVMAQAQDVRLPLLERLKFLSIVASNTDEFFMKRIGGLKQQIGAGIRDLSVDGRTPERQIEECERDIHDIEKTKNKLFIDLCEELEKHGVRLVSCASLAKDDQEWLKQYYLDNIFPLCTPLGMDPAHPFPFISNLSLNLLVSVKANRYTDPRLVRIKVPVGSDVRRFIRVRNTLTFVSLEDLMASNIDLLFPDMIVETVETFRVTRNANTEQDEENADDLLELIESELRERKFAPIVRLEVSEEMVPAHRKILATQLGLDEEDVYETPGMMGKRHLMELVDIQIPELRYPPHSPVDHPQLHDQRNIFHILRDEEAMLIHHPYQSFASSVVRFLREASTDPKVRAIKMTLYRTSSDSDVIRYLIDAARNGKNVSVVVELKARFDEAANIEWATRLEEAGIHVNYGVVGFKTHTKVILVIRKDFDKLRRYVHVGTGNYHPGTARLYVDLGLLTTDERICEDVTNFFNFLTTGISTRGKYRKLLVAPTHQKKALLGKIEREIEHQTAGDAGHIQIKTNALEDADICRALYRASQAGVKIELLVRDTCRIRPGIVGLSENIRVVSIVGRFLEHSRIYYFRNGGDEEYYIGSADLMKRNLESRVEILCPIDDTAIREELRDILDRQLSDVRLGWTMKSDGSYERDESEEAREAKGSQEFFLERARRRSQRASKFVKKIAKARLRGRK